MISSFTCMKKRDNGIVKFDNNISNLRKDKKVKKSRKCHKNWSYLFSLAHIGTWNKWYHYIRLEGLLLLSKKCRDVIESHKSTIFCRIYQKFVQKTRWLFQLSFVTKRISEYKITMAILIYTRWNLSFIILWVSCGKKLGKKSDCNSSWDILFHFTSFYKYQLCKNTKTFSSRLTSNSVKMQQMCYHPFLSKGIM